MARAAASEFGADWVINSDADEFWWPRGHDLKSVLGALPERYGVVAGLWRPFVPVPDDGSPFYERMTARFAPSDPVNDPTSKFRPNTKVAHRADPQVTVGRGNHTSVGSHHLLLRGWYPIEVLHFPFRTPAQLEVKSVKSDTHAGPKRGGYLRRLATEAGAQPGAGVFAGMVVDAATLDEGLARGSLVRDLRLRDALRSIAETETGRFTLPGDGSPGLALAPPSIVDDASFAAEVAVLGEANFFRAVRRLDDLERRLQALEAHPALRVGRSLRSLAQRARRR